MPFPSEDLYPSPSLYPGGVDPGEYDIRLGPLRFVAPADAVGEAVGDGLEAVGAALTAADRRPRSMKLKLPVRADDRLSDFDTQGKRLRRQVRALFNNARWRLQGFYLHWSADPDIDGWLLVGAGDLTETDPGISFGDFELDMSDVYVVGRAGTHRPGRRCTVSDRRSGLVARDTRRLLYSTDFASQALPSQPVALPGDIVDVIATAAPTPGLSRIGRTLWQSTAATDGQVVTYMPDAEVLPGEDRYLEIEETGAVRVWDLAGAATYPPDPDSYVIDGELDPETYYGWERILGDALSPERPLAMDNGACRLIWLGPGPDQGLAIEYWRMGRFRRLGRVLHAADVREQRVVELTPERAVLEWRAGRYALRAILQRGWWGPRLESYDDSGGVVRLEYAPEGDSDVATADQTPAWVKEITATGAEPLLWATGAADEAVYSDPFVLQGVGSPPEVFGTSRDRVLVAQLGPPAGPVADALASLSLVDARGVPVLVARS